MNRTGLAYHPDCLKHALLPGKPETPDRVSGTLDHLRQTGLIDRLRQLTPDPPSEEDLLRVHDPRLIEYVRDLSENGMGRRKERGKLIIGGQENVKREGRCEY